MKQHYLMRPKVVFALSSFLVLFLGWLDYITGRDFGFFVFYFIPIAYTAWRTGLRSAIAVSILSEATWFTADFVTVHNFAFLFFSLWNSLIRLIAFLLLAFFINKISMLLAIERKKTEELQAAFAKIKTLGGLIPICSSCKKIRNDQGYWEQIEKYIEEHSDADFTHGICEACAKKLYPSYCRGDKPK